MYTCITHESGNLFINISTFSMLSICSKKKRPPPLRRCALTCQFVTLQLLQLLGNLLGLVVFVGSYVIYNYLIYMLINSDRISVFFIHLQARSEPTFRYSLGKQGDPPLRDFVHRNADLDYSKSELIHTGVDFIFDAVAFQKISRIEFESRVYIFCAQRRSLAIVREIVRSTDREPR